MAEVYRGFDVKLKRAVAVKVLPATLASDPNYVQRFRTEAQRVAALNHPHIVPVYHFGEEGPLLYHVMPLFNESLRDRLEREGMLAPKEAVRLIVQIASALSVAHAAGLVHRDVKPENILLNDKDEALLTDFGIARPADDVSHRPHGADTLGDGTTGRHTGIHGARAVAWRVYRRARRHLRAGRRAL